MSTPDPNFFDKKTPARRRINSEETAKGYRISGTAEGEDFVVTVSETDKKDIAKPIYTSLGAELASAILATRVAFRKAGLPLAINDLKTFVEEQSRPKPPVKVKVNGKEVEK